MRYEMKNGNSVQLPRLGIQHACLVKHLSIWTCLWGYGERWLDGTPIPRSKNGIHTCCPSLLHATRSNAPAPYCLYSFQCFRSSNSAYHPSVPIWCQDLEPLLFFIVQPLDQSISTKDSFFTCRFDSRKKNSQPPWTHPCGIPKLIPMTILFWRTLRQREF
jgi:hypothetical protein